jgi:hypothetical protein
MGSEWNGNPETLELYRTRCGKRRTGSGWIVGYNRKLSLSLILDGRRATTNRHSKETRLSFSPKCADKSCAVLGVHPIFWGPSHPSLLCIGVEDVPMSPRYRRVASRWEFSVLARICARRFSVRVGPGNPDQSPQCELRGPHRFAALSLPPERPKLRSAPFILFSSADTSALLIVERFCVSLMTKGS